MNRFLKTNNPELVYINTERGSGKSIHTEIIVIEELLKSLSKIEEQFGSDVEYYGISREFRRIRNYLEYRHSKLTKERTK